MPGRLWRRRSGETDGVKGTEVLAGDDAGGGVAIIAGAQGATGATSSLSGGAGGFMRALWLW